MTKLGEAVQLDLSRKDRKHILSCHVGGMTSNLAQTHWQSPGSKTAHQLLQ